MHGYLACGERRPPEVSLLVLLAWILTAAYALPPYAEAPALPSVAPVEDPFSWDVQPAIVHADAEGRIELHLLVPEGHVIYQDQLEVRVIEAGPLLAGDADYPPAELVDDPATSAGHPRPQYPEDVVVWVPVRAPAGFTGGVSLTIETRHQGCKPGLCFSPVTQQHTVLVAVRADDGAAGAE